jgi:hypothetical protein
MANAFPCTSRRAALGSLTLGTLLAAAADGSASAANPPQSETPVNEDLEQLKRQLASAPRRRRFGTVPFMVTRRDQWDHEAAEAVLAYRNRALQV